MNEAKLKSIRSVGLVIVICSLFMMFTNTVGLVSAKMVGLVDQMREESVGRDFNFVAFMLSNYLLVVVFILANGGLFLLGGWYLMKYKMWANRLVTLCSGLMIAFFLIFGLSMSYSEFDEKDALLFRVSTIVGSLFWSVPFGLLIWYLNKPSIKQHFG